MANTFASGSFQQFWSRAMQRIHEVVDVYRAIANFDEKPGILTQGQTFNRPYKTALTVNDMGSDGSYARQDVTVTNQQLSVDQKKEATFYIEDYNALQSNYKLGMEFARHTAIKLANQVDGQVFGNYDEATSSVDDGDIGGTSGNGLTLTTSNVLKMFTIAARKLGALNIQKAGRWGVISYEFYEKMLEYLGGKESNLGDTVGVNGHIGKYMGFELYASNALGWSSRLEFATNPSEGDTITINGVAFNFKATLGAVAGTIHICSDAENTLNQLVAAINTPGTTVASATDAGFVAVSTANQNLLKNIVATDGATYMTLKGTGKSFVAISETLTAAADIWTTTKQIQHNLFGQGKPIDVVIQKYPKLETFHRDGYVGKDFVTWTLFGIKTFNEGKDELIDVQVRSDAY